MLSANVLVFWAIAADAAAGRLGLAQVVTFLSAGASTASNKSAVGQRSLSWRVRLKVLINRLTY